ncbi:MAG: DUF4870 domain-containing protein [Thermoanaerobaculia bacterium]
MSEPVTPPPPPTTPPPTSGGSQSSNRGLMIALSYLWLLCLVPLLVEKDDKEVQWHARHGLVLMLAEIVLWIGLAILSMILGMITGGLGCLLAPLQLILWLLVLVVHIMAIVKGVNGQRLILPGISQYADKINF